MLAALGEDWTGGADGLCFNNPLASARPTLSLGMKEHLRRVVAAGALELPLPVAGSWHW